MIDFIKKLLKYDQKTESPYLFGLALPFLVSLALMTRPKIIDP